MDFQRQFFDLLLLSQYWPRERMVAYQRQRLAAVVQHARAHTRYYRKRLDPLFRADGSIDWERWTDLPVVRRADIMADPEAFDADELPPGHGPSGEIKTSGSTGRRMTVRYTGTAAATTQAAKWRCDIWHGFDWSKNLYVRYGEHPDEAEWPNGQALGHWGPPWETRARQGQAFRLHKQVDNDKQLDFMRRIGATYMAPGGPKQAHSLALLNEREGLRVKVAGILTSGEQVENLDREVCRRAFGSDIMDIYASKEGNHMAYRCPSQTCWHVNAETLLLEILDDNDRPCLPGEMGRVVITPFFSSAQPLIRYDHGDLAIAGERCICGRTLPVISELLGRVAHLFRHPDGRVIKRNFPDEYRELLKSGPWQIAQVGPNDYELRYIPLDWADMGDEAGTAEAFKRVFFPDATLTFRRVAAIQPIASGKYIEYVNEYAQPV